tara:strand:- start:1909 stop:3432 length:1524 start_codon:yes stop_codon:yes gene_type:complete
MSKKIIELEDLKKIIKKLKNNKKKIVLCHGVFDLLHVGHIKYFEEAKLNGDKLIVSVTSDEYVNKGPNRPAFNSHQRLEAIQALEVVDYVVLSKFSTAINIIKEIKPDVYCKGPDYKDSKKDITGEIKNEIKNVKLIGGKTIFTSGATFSSSKLINQLENQYSSNRKSALSLVKKNFSFDQIKNFVDDFKKIKVLVIGEIIIDQYIFCEALGKSGKEPVIVMKDIKTEQYLGGAGAISRHLSSFCKKISLLSMIGEKKEYLKDIKKDLPSNVSFNYITKNNSPTIFKKRYLDFLSLRKIIGVDSLNDDSLNEKDEKLFNKFLRTNIPKHDLVVVSDYGHGLISNKSAKLICKFSKYVALNAQINAANIGYHSMSKYQNIDCLIVNEKELRHEMRDKKNTIEPMIKKFSKKQNIKNIIVTQGVTGSLLYDKKKNQFTHCEAFAKTAIDKVGAGDTMLSLIALFLKLNINKNLSMFVSSLGAAESVKNIGNKVALSKTKVLKAISHLLK